jgi:hypothetical protein
MQIKVKATGNVYHIENKDWVQIMLESGLIEQVIEAPPVKKLGRARWWVNYNIASNSSRPTIIAQCDECHAQQIFEDGLRMVDAKTGRIPPSQLHKAFIEHCKKRELVPEHIVDEYFKVLDGVNR